MPAYSEAGGNVEQATCTITLGTRQVVLGVNPEQLATREPGDLITAEIVAVSSGAPTSEYSDQRGGQSIPLKEKD